MKTYQIKGFMKPKGQEDKEWQKIGEGVGIKLPDEVDPYEEIQKNFKLISSRWLFTIDEIKDIEKE